MSNQRAGKWKSATLDDGYRDSSVYTFFQKAQQALETKGEEDAAFYFEQVVEHIKQGGNIFSDRVERVLGL